MSETDAAPKIIEIRVIARVGSSAVSIWPPCPAAIQTHLPRPNRLPAAPPASAALVGKTRTRIAGRLAFRSSRAGRDFPLDPTPHGTVGDIKIVARLKIDPELR